MFEFIFAHEADAQFAELQKNPALKKRYKAVSKSLRFLAANTRLPGLQTHKYETLEGENGEDVFEAYAEQDTPGAYRIFWHYGPNRPKKKAITIVAITPRPKQVPA